MSRPIRTTETNVSVTIKIIDSTDGTPETGVTAATSGLDIWYRKGVSGAQTSLTESNLSALTDAHSDGGMLHIDDGLYRVDIPDAAVPDSAGEITTIGGGATGMIVLGCELVGVTDLTAAEVNAEADTALTDYDPPTKAELDSGFAALNDPTAAAIADAVADEVLTAGSHDVADSLGQRIRLLHDADSPAKATVSDVSPSASGFDTDLSDADGFWDDALFVFIDGALAGQSRPISSYLQTSGAVTFDEPFSSAPSNGDGFVIRSDHIHPVSQIADAIADEPLAGHTTAGSLGKAIADIETDAAAILDDTGTTLQAELDGIQADTEDIQSRLPAALTGDGNIKSDLLRINGDANAAARLALSAAQMIPGTVNDAITTPTTTAFAAIDITEATADHYNGRLVLWTSGALTGQVTDVTDYALTSGEGVFTVTAMTEAPADGDTFLLV